MKKKVVLTGILHDFVLKELKKRYKVQINTGKIPISHTKLETMIKDANGLICFPYDNIDRKVLDIATKLEAISTYSVGFDHIDVQYAKKRKIRVGYTPEVLTDATADLTFALLLDLARRVSEGDRMIRKNSWKSVLNAIEYNGIDIESKTLGIFGLGRIGSAFAKRANAFGMKIIYHNRKPVLKSKEKALHARYVSFKELLMYSDVISIHAPYSTETKHIFDGKAFAKMKNSSFLINTSRGKLVNEADLVLALQNKDISGAALDVFEIEPIGKNHPLSKLQNVVLSPHIGSSTKETREIMAKITLKNLNLGLNGEKPVYSVGY